MVLSWQNNTESGFIESCSTTPWKLAQPMLHHILKTGKMIYFFHSFHNISLFQTEFTSLWILELFATHGLNITDFHHYQVMYTFSVSQ
jgi:hypothetical protein